MLRLLFVTTLIFGFGSACGKDALQRACADDDDCRSGEVCAGGLCLDGSDVDAGENNPPCEGDECPSVCEDDSHCPDGDSCNREIGACVSGECRAEGMLCVQTLCTEEGCGDELCPVGPCPPGFAAQGCDCAPAPCESNEACDGLFCVEGQCQGCADDSWCAEGEFCDESGACLEDTRCMSDDDCDPDERCRRDVCIPRAECFLDDDCRRAGELCIGGQCILAPECSEDQDCREGFECIGGNCLEQLCRGPQDCENGQLCDGGECIDPPIATSCFVATPSGLISPGEQVRLEAFAVNAQGVGVSATFAWTSSNPAVAAVNQQVAVGGNGTGAATITATLAGGDPVVCSGEVRLTNPGPVPVTGMRVVVVNLQTGAPITNANVIVGNNTQTTNQAGVANLPNPNGTYEVTVVHPDYNILTVQGVDSTDIRLPLSQRRGSGPVGGFTGQFDTSAIGSSGEVTIGLAGASLAGGLLEVDLISLLGDTFDSAIQIPGIVDTTFPLPGGIVAYGAAFGFTLNIKDTYYARSAAGARMAWGLAGKIPLSEILSLAQGGGQDLVLATLLPLFNRFDHQATPFLSAAIPQVPDTQDINANGDTTELIPDYDSMPEIELRPSQRQTLSTDVEISNFPVLTNGPAELAVLIGGTVLDSPGLVPLGISATNDEDQDGRPDSRRLSIAPPSGSLVGGRYALVAIAFTTDGGGFGPDGLPNDLSVSLWNGQSFPSSIRLGTFPGASTTSFDASSRQVSFTASAGPVYRVRVVGPNRTWDIWSTGAPGQMGTFNHTISIPNSPLSGVDPLQNGEILLDAIRTNVTTDDLVRSTGVGLKNAGLVSTAFNRSTVR